ncbi:Multi antimicrobial extrusion protein [Raphanus sativus]|nr:Multi antimicrobial extrusion protein [Raphanus sativus]
MEVNQKEVDQIRWEKLKKVASMAVPMVVVNISQTLLQATSTMIVGHKSEISLAGIALASSIANVTGFSLLSGLASALETFCGQALELVSTRSSVHILSRPLFLSSSYVSQSLFYGFS